MEAAKEFDTPQRPSPRVPAFGRTVYLSGFKGRLPSLPILWSFWLFSALSKGLTLTTHAPSIKEVGPKKHCKTSGFRHSTPLIEGVRTSTSLIPGVCIVREPARNSRGFWGIGGASFGGNWEPTLKTLTSLNKEVRPFFLGDTSIWHFPSLEVLKATLTLRLWHLGHLSSLSPSTFIASLLTFSS